MRQIILLFVLVTSTSMTAQEFDFYCFENGIYEGLNNGAVSICEDVPISTFVWYTQKLRFHIENKHVVKLELIYNDEWVFITDWPSLPVTISKTPHGEQISMWNGDCGYSNWLIINT